MESPPVAPPNTNTEIVRYHEIIRPTAELTFMAAEGAVKLGSMAIDKTVEFARAAGHGIKWGAIDIKDDISRAYDKSIAERSARAEDRIERMNHKDDFYSALGATALAVLEGRSQTSVTRIAPRTWFERKADKRLEKRIDKLMLRRVQRDNQGTNHNQTHGIRPMLSQVSRHREAGGRYKRGGITRSQLETEKLNIRATRSSALRVHGADAIHKPVAVRNVGQRVAMRKLAREAYYTAMHSGDQAILPHWRELRRKSAKRTVRKASARPHATVTP